jgi:osmotically-inducible protein OsmY
MRSRTQLIGIVCEGVVVLRGRVFDERDLRTALRTARKATGHNPVIDSLSIEQGGR